MVEVCSDNYSAKAYSSLGGSSDEEKLLLNFFEPPESFWRQMKPKSVNKTPLKCIAYLLSLTMDDFLHDLTLYAQQFSEIREIYAFMVQHKEWFDQLLNYLRSGLYQQ